MNSDTRDLIAATAAASNDGTMHFGQVIEALQRAGVESYHADYRAQRVVYYLANEELLELPLPGAGTIAFEFRADALKAAILGAQRGTVMYPEFKQRSREAGCIGYIVWLAGRKITYFGRKGECHTEYFPGSD